MSRISHATTVGFLVLLVGVFLFGIHLSSMMALMAFIGTFVIYNPTQMLPEYNDSTQPEQTSNGFNRAQSAHGPFSADRKRKTRITHVGSVPAGMNELTGQ